MDGWMDGSMEWCMQVAYRTPFDYDYALLKVVYRTTEQRKTSYALLKRLKQYLTQDFHIPLP